MNIALIGKAAHQVWNVSKYWIKAHKHTLITAVVVLIIVLLCFSSCAG